MKNTTAETQLSEASEMGTKAFHAGMQRAAYLDRDMEKFFVGRTIGQTPKGEAPSVEILKAWTNAWDKANSEKARKLLEKDSPQIIGEDNAPMFSVYNDGDLSIPVVANCPIKNLDKAIDMFNDCYTIRKHFTKESFN